MSGSTIDTMNRALKVHYGPALEASVLGQTKTLQYLYRRSDLDRHLATVRKYRRRMKWHVSRRRRAAYLGLLRRAMRSAKAARKALRSTNYEPTFFDVLMEKSNS